MRGNGTEWQPGHYAQRAIARSDIGALSQYLGGSGHRLAVDRLPPPVGLGVRQWSNRSPTAIQWNGSGCD